MSFPLSSPLAADLELARRHAAGDASAFDEVYRRHAGLVFNLCWRLVGEREEALDLAQEVFLRVHRHLGGFGGRASLRTWIYRVTVNSCRSRLSRKRPVLRPLEDLTGPGREPAEPGPDPEVRASGAELERHLAAALEGLPIAFREAVVLRDVEGLAYDEIAEVLKVPVGTVRSRIARGREALRDRLRSLS